MYLNLIALLLTLPVCHRVKNIICFFKLLRVNDTSGEQSAMQGCNVDGMEARSFITGGYGHLPSRLFFCSLNTLLCLPIMPHIKLCQFEKNLNYPAEQPIFFCLHPAHKPRHSFGLSYACKSRRVLRPSNG